MELNQAQTELYRRVAGHYAERFQVSDDSFADSAHIDPGRHRAIMAGYGNTLDESETSSFVEWCEELKNAEAREVFDLKRHGLPVPRTLADVVKEFNQSLAERS
jgi:hypothetical protein